MDEYLCRRAFPAEVLMPDGTFHRKALAFVTSHRLIVWGEDAGGITKVLEEPLDVPFEVAVDRRPIRHGERIEATLASGTVFVNAMSGCGCHSRLRAVSAPVDYPRHVRV